MRRSLRILFVEDSTDDTHVVQRWLRQAGLKISLCQVQTAETFAEALQREKRDAVIRWVMRGRKRVGVLRARAGHLLLVALREADEVVPPDRLEAPPGAAPEARELKLAQQLVRALEGPFEPERYRDTYQDRVKDLIAAKAKGKRLPAKRAPRKRPAPASLAGALAASLRAAGKERRRA